MGVGHIPQFHRCSDFIDTSSWWSWAPNQGTQSMTKKNENPLRDLSKLAAVAVFALLWDWLSACDNSSIRMKKTKAISKCKKRNEKTTLFVSQQSCGCSCRQSRKQKIETGKAVCSQTSQHNSTEKTLLLDAKACRSNQHQSPTTTSMHPASVITTTMDINHDAA